MRLKQIGKIKWWNEPGEKIKQNLTRTRKKLKTYNSNEYTRNTRIVHRKQGKNWYY
ncbi:hypothetical protein HYD82_03905 [Mycoplasmopsis bovis]|nr:hypothetical protein HYD82_03905 [Mycoplasmopsis bovis]